MIRICRVTVSFILIICILMTTSIVLLADTPDDISKPVFPYNNASNYVADCIDKGIIDMNGISMSESYSSIAILYQYTYETITEALINDPVLVFNSTYWQNIGSAIDGDFMKMANWQKDMYVVLIMDYLNYSEKDDVYERNLEKKSFEFSEKIFKKAYSYADSEYLKNVDDLIKNQSLTEAVEFSNKYGLISEINKYTTLVGDIEKVSKSAYEYYENLSKALAIKSADESRITFLKQMKEAGCDNKYFSEAVDEVIKAYQATFAELTFSEGFDTMSSFGVKECFSLLSDSIPELKFILKSLSIYSSGLDWLFNSDDISENNLKLLTLYMMGSYAITALNSLRDNYTSNPTEENAESLIGGFLAFLKYHEYATSSTYGFVSSALFNGIINNVKNFISHTNQETYEDFKNFLDHDITFSQNLANLVNNSYSRYFNIIDYNVDLFEDSNMEQTESQEEIDTDSEVNNISSERDIVLVLDTSGSMAGTPLEETKNASVNFVDTILEENASIGVVNYDDESNIASDFSNSKSALDSVINDLGVGGSTNIESGLRTADQMLQQSTAEKKIIVLMSDGEPNQGMVGDALIAYADKLKDKGIYIYTLGFFESIGDKTAAQSLMEKLASDGCHYEVSDADSLVFFFGDIADQINGQKYIYVRIACPVDVSVTYQGQTLSSAEKDLNLRTDYGTLTFEESEEESVEGVDNSIKVLRLKEGTDYDLELSGTGRGVMNYTIGFMDDDGDFSDLRKFRNIRINKKTKIDTVAAVSSKSVLNIDEDGDGKYDLKMSAEINGYGKEVKIPVWIWYSISAVVVFILIDIIAIIVLKKKKHKR